MSHNLNQLFEVEEKLSLEFNFKRMFLEGYKIVPKHSKNIIFPVAAIMFMLGLAGIIGEFYSFFKNGYGLGIISFLAPVTLIGISITIYVGTAHYWFKIKQKEIINKNYSSDFKSKHPDYTYRASAQKSLFDKMLSVLSARYYIPRIKFEYNYKTKYIGISVADVTRTVADNLSPGADSQLQFAVIFITIKGLSVPDVKLLETSEVLAWVEASLGANLAALSHYKLLLRVKENNIIIEFDEEITNPENKLKLLDYLRDQTAKSIKNEPEPLNLVQIKNLYTSEQEVGIKHSFKLFEAAQWDLAKIITYVKENFTKENQSLDLRTMLVERTFILGPVILTYYVYQDAAQGVEDTDYFYLHFYIDFEEKENIFISHDYEEKNIASGELIRLYFEEDDIPDFTPQMDEHFEKHIQKLDLPQKENVYDYLIDFYTQYTV